MDATGRLGDVRVAWGTDDGTEHNDSYSGYYSASDGGGDHSATSVVESFGDMSLIDTSALGDDDLSGEASISTSAVSELLASLSFESTFPERARQFARYCELLESGPFDVDVFREIERTDPVRARLLPFAVTDDQFRMLFPQFTAVRTLAGYSRDSGLRTRVLARWDDTNRDDLRFVHSLSDHHRARLVALASIPWSCDAGYLPFHVWLSSAQAVLDPLVDEDYTVVLDALEENLCTVPAILFGALAASEQGVVEALQLYDVLSPSQRRWLAAGCTEATMREPQVLDVIREWPPTRIATFVSHISDVALESLVDAHTLVLRNALVSAGSDMRCLADYLLGKTVDDVQSVVDRSVRRNAAVMGDPILKIVARSSLLDDRTGDAREAIFAVQGAFQAIEGDRVYINTEVLPRIVESDVGTALPDWLWQHLTEEAMHDLGLPSWSYLTSIGLEAEEDLALLGIDDASLSKVAALRRSIENVFDVIRVSISQERLPEVDTPFMESIHRDEYWSRFFELSTVHSVNRIGFSLRDDPTMHYSALFAPGNDSRGRGVRELFRFLCSSLDYVDMGDVDTGAMIRSALDDVERLCRELGVDPRRGYDESVGSDFQPLAHHILWKGVCAAKTNVLAEKLRAYLTMTQLDDLAMVYSDARHADFFPWFEEAARLAGQDCDAAALSLQFGEAPDARVPNRVLKLYVLIRRWNDLREGKDGLPTVNSLSALATDDAFEEHFLAGWVRNQGAEGEPLVPTGCCGILGAMLSG